MLLLVVTRFADVDLLIGGKTTGSTFVVAGMEHDKTTIYDFVNLMVSILTSLDDLIWIEMLVKAMDCLLRTIVPAGIDVSRSRRILPGAKDLRNNWLGQIIRVLNMHPIT